MVTTTGLSFVSTVVLVLKPWTVVGRLEMSTVGGVVSNVKLRVLLPRFPFPARSVAASAGRLMLTTPSLVG